MKLLSLLSPGGSHLRRRGAAPGLTLLELTIVITVILTLVLLMFVGGATWKRGSDRALCIVNLEMMQKAVRSYSNLYDHGPGDTVTGLEGRVIGSERFIDSMPDCPGGGAYETLGDLIPAVGTPYATCSLSSSKDHAVVLTTGW